MHIITRQDNMEGTALHGQYCQLVAANQPLTSHLYKQDKTYTGVVAYFMMYCYRAHSVVKCLCHIASVLPFKSTLCDICCYAETV